MSHTDDPFIGPFVAAAREELSWLADDGYEEVRARVDPTGFTLQWASPRGRVSLEADLARGENDLMLAPPDPDDWRTPIDILRGPRTGIKGLLAVHGLDAPVPPGRDLDAFRRFLRALRGLRETELAGDWSRFDEARAHVRALAAQDAKKLDIPILRELGLYKDPPPDSDR